MRRTVYWQDGAVRMIDQNRLPVEDVEVAYRDWRDVAESIRVMTVRGAPAIGVAAAYGLVLAASDIPRDGFQKAFDDVCEVFRGTRPTAVNLFWAIERMRLAANKLSGEPDIDLPAALLREAEAIADEDIAANQAIGRFGADLLPDEATVLTHCNAGALACAGYGTALGVIRSAVEAGKRIQVLADETRPRLQGLKLTAYELQRDGIPVTALADNASGSLMRAGKIDAVVVGADRIAANGDAANKIGTYNVAVLANYHGIPFYVAAPWSTIDTSLASGDLIPIEERDASEITEVGGVRVAPEGVEVYNPAFDVTPAALITAIITESGVYRPPYDFRNQPQPGQSPDTET